MCNHAWRPRVFQDTVVAIAGLTQYATLTFVEDVDLTVRFHGTALEGATRVNNTNRMVAQRRDGVAVPNQLRMVVTGVGCMLLQVRRPCVTLGVCVCVCVCVCVNGHFITVHGVLSNVHAVT